MEITNREKTVEINDFLSENNMDQLFWIGLSELGSAGGFLWASTGQGADYTYWAIGEPSSGFDEGCVHLNLAVDERTWSDRPCFDSHLYALCERGY